MEKPWHVGRYRLDWRLAVGGSAEVWRGMDEQLGRVVAVKVLHSHLVPDDAARRRLEREARAAARLSHPGIVTVYDIVRVGDRVAIVLELVEGESLAERLARAGRLPAAEAVRIAAELGTAMLHAHQRGVIHRDVKPGNVLLDGNGRARLTDFGIARVLADQQERLTAAGSITGTLRYLAPERLAGEDGGPRADIYGLGVVLYEMLAGRPPFEAITPVSLAAAQYGTPPPIPGVDQELWRVVVSALQSDPDRRPRTAGEMAGELRRIASATRRPADVDPMRSDTTILFPRVAGDETPDGPPQPSRSSGGRRAAFAGLLLVGATLLVGAMVFANAGRPGAVASPTPASRSPSPPSVATPEPDLGAAYADLAEIVIAGRTDGTIDEGAAEDLLNHAQEVVEKATGGEADDVVKALEELRQKIDEFVVEGRVDALVAERLRQATDGLDAAAGGP